MPPKKQRAERPPSAGRQPLAPHKNAPPEVVDPVWLLRALAVSFAAALVCGWLTLCFLFYQGEWQLVLHPGKTVDITPASSGLAFDEVRFDPGESGQPRLTGWWVPAGEGARYAKETVLLLHDGSGSLSATVPLVARLHEAGVGVFAFDYRGFGLSDASVRPSEARMQDDAEAALGYLTSLRHLDPASIVPYGAGLGGSLAVKLAANHPELLAVVVDNPDPDAMATAMAAQPSRVIPVQALFRERFEIAGPLAKLHTPKLLIAGGPESGNTTAQIDALQTLFRRAVSPKFTVTLPARGYDADFQRAVEQFLDQNVGGAMR